MEHDNNCIPPEKTSCTGEAKPTRDKNWDKWISKCNELNTLCKLNEAENKLDTSDDKPNVEDDNDSKEVCQVAVSALGDSDDNDKLRGDIETTDTKHDGDDASASVLKRMTTAPELYEKTHCHDKILKKRNTLPASLTNTLLMVGRLHDVAETAIEEKLKYLEMNEEKPTDKNKQDPPNIDKNSVNISETSNTARDGVKTVTDEESVSANVEDNKNLTEHALNDAEKEGGNGTVQDYENEKVQKDNCPKSDVPQDEQVSGKDVANEADAIRPEKITRQPTATDIKIQLNDNSVESTTALQIEQDSVAADAAKTDSVDVAADVTNAASLSAESTSQPFVINVSSCSTATIEPELELGAPVDQNFLFVGDPDTSSLNGFDLAAEPETKLNCPTDDSESPARVPGHSRHDSGVYNGNHDADENLEEARNRMHTLLDQAFSLITPRASITESDIRNKNKDAPMPSPNDPPEDAKTDSGRSSKWELQDPGRGSDVKHEPMYINPAYSSSFSDFPLETWSPYRAFDQVALISMPQKLDPGPTKLGQKSEVIQASQKSSKRPVANFDFNESKSTSAIDDAKYTTNPPKPIVLRTKDLPGSQTAAGKNGNFSATGLNGDVYLTGSTTSISGPKSKNTSDKMEMKSYPNGSRHRAPSKDSRNKDEVDVVNNLKPEEKSEDLLRSLREELNVLKENYKEPKPGKRRRSTARPMTDVV